MKKSEELFHENSKINDLVIHEMHDSEFKRYCQFSFENFVADSARSAGKTVEELRPHLGKGPDTRSENDLWLIVLFQNKEAGFVWLQTNPLKNESFGYDIFLKPEYRSQGIGRLTMNGCLKLLRERRINRVKICVFQENSIARKLYDSLGFKEIDFNPERRQYMLELAI